LQNLTCQVKGWAVGHGHHKLKCCKLSLVLAASSARRACHGKIQLPIDQQAALGQPVVLLLLGGRKHDLSVQQQLLDK
jgi:hypothetical protein